MDSDDYNTQDIVPPLSPSHSGNGDNASPEDLAWADSCLIGDPELSEGDLNSFGNAFSLLGIHSSQLESSVNEKVELVEAAGKKISLVNRKGRSSLILDKTTYNPPGNEQEENRIDSDHRMSEITDAFSCSPPENEQEEEKVIDYDHISESSDALSSRFNSENIFLPTYNENHRIFVTDDPEVDSMFPTFLENQPAENIFKVWELDIPDEDDELIGQVKEALAEISLEPVASVSDDSGSRVRSIDESLDELVSGFADMSLSRKSR